MQKNVASQDFHVVAFNASGRISGIAGNITCELSIDGGTRNPTNDVNPTEIGTTGEYIFNLTQAETNGYELSFTPESSTGAQVVGMPSNVIYTSTVTPTYVIPQSVIDQAVLPAGTTSVYQASQWTITLEGIPNDEYANTDAVYFGIKSADEADADMPLQIRWDKTANTTEVIRVNGAAPTGTLDDDGALITHSTYTEGGDTLHRYVLVVEGEVTVSVPTTFSLNNVSEIDPNRIISQRNNYTSEWKIVGDTDLVISSGSIVVLPTVNRVVE